MNNFSKRLTELRKEKGLTQAELADKLGVLQRSVSHWENGTRECDFETLIKLSIIFSVSTDYLLGKTDY